MREFGGDPNDPHNLWSPLPRTQTLRLSEQPERQTRKPAQRGSVLRSDESPSCSKHDRNRRYTVYRAAQGADASTDGARELLANIDEVGGLVPGRRKSVIGAPPPPLRTPRSKLRPSRWRRNRWSRLAWAAARTSVPAPPTEQSAQRKPRGGLSRGNARPDVGIRPDAGAHPRREGRPHGYPVHRPRNRRPRRPAQPRASKRPRRQVAEANGWNIIHTDHAIWRFESGRPVNREQTDS